MLRPMHGEPLDAFSREVPVPALRREPEFAGITAALKERESDPTG